MASKDILVSRPAARTSPDSVAPLADHDDRLCRYCAGCDLWLNNPREELQSFLPISNDTTSRVLIKAVEDWNSGAAEGCLLCDLVRAVTGEIGRAHNYKVADELQLWSLLCIASSSYLS